jgi:PiT family inorganic phosphate transporter
VSVTFLSSERHPDPPDIRGKANPGFTMTDITMHGRLDSPPSSSPKPKLDQPINPLGLILFFGIMAAGFLFVAYSLYVDVDASGTKVVAYLPYLLLFVALVIALGFEFVNGFHDTANAVATVIYTNSMPAPVAVLWSGFFNFLGVLVSSGAVAFGIVSLLPVELILQVGSAAGFAMVFALLIAAIIWNLGTWYLGLPASSSHTMIGSIIGVGIANALMRGRDGTSGVDWSKATEIVEALLLSPVFGFCLAAIVLLALRFFVRNPALYSEPKGNQPPPWWIRGVLILTCTGVSFAHGSNDGQKGMGLIMLILIGTVPTAYALNRAMPASQMVEFRTASEAAASVIAAKAAGYNILGNPRPAVTAYVSERKRNEGTYPSLSALVKEISAQIEQYGTLSNVPAVAVGNTRNDMYLASEAIRFLIKDKESDLSKDEVAALNNYKKLSNKTNETKPASRDDGCREAIKTKREHTILSRTIAALPAEDRAPCCCRRLPCVRARLRLYCPRVNPWESSRWAFSSWCLDSSSSSARTSS